MAVVLDGSSEALLVVAEVERRQQLVPHSPPGDDVDGRLEFPCAGVVRAVPFVWRWRQRKESADNSLCQWMRRRRRGKLTVALMVAGELGLIAPVWNTGTQ